MSSDSEDDKIAATAIIILASVQTKRGKRVWTKPWLKKWRQFGVCDTLLREFRSEEEGDYFNFLRMSQPATFEIP